MHITVQITVLYLRRANQLVYYSKNLTDERSCTTKYEKKTLIEDGSSHIYASFGTRCVQIGQLFEAQWAFEECLKIDKSSFSKENVADFEFFRMFKDSLRLE